MIFFLAKKGQNAIASEMETTFEWFFIVRAHTIKKDATDCEIVSSSIAHHFILSEKPDIKFLLISRDGFIHETKAILEERGRTCFIADGFGIKPAAALLHMIPDLPREKLEELAKSEDEVRARVAGEILKGITETF